MIHHVMVAVDDSAPALTAAARAIDLACVLDAELHLATVVEPGRDADTILQHVASMAETAGLAVVTWKVNGEREPFEALLEAARGCRADLVVMGRSDRRRGGRPYVGSQTEHFLEFSEVPVMVVPESSSSDP